MGDRFIRSEQGDDGIVVLIIDDPECHATCRPFARMT